MKQGSSFAKKQGTAIALACAAMFAAPAMAQVATPDFGAGKGLTLSIDFVIGVKSSYATNATAGIASNTSRRTEVWSSSSSIYLKGSEKLDGNFINGWGFVWTTDFDPDEYNRRGSTEGAITVAGLQTTAGSVFIGVMDGVMKQFSGVNWGGGSTYGQGLSQSAAVGTPGFRTGTAKGGIQGSAASGSASTTSTMSFYRLNANSINYHSPTMGGFKVYAQYVPGDSDQPAGITNQDTYQWGLGASYANGPFNVGYVYEKHNDYLWGPALVAGNFGLGSTALAAGSGDKSKDTGQLLTAGVTFGDFKIGATWQRLEYQQSSTTGAALNLTDLKVDGWNLGLKWRSGPHEIGAVYATAGNLSCAGASATLVNLCNTDTGMKMYGVGYRYALSKQIKLLAGVARMDNEKNAQYHGHGAPARVSFGGATNPAGLTLTNFSVGLSSSF